MCLFSSLFCLFFKSSSTPPFPPSQYQLSTHMISQGSVQAQGEKCLICIWKLAGNMHSYGWSVSCSRMSGGPVPSVLSRSNFRASSLLAGQLSL